MFPGKKRAGRMIDAVFLRMPSKELSDRYFKERQKELWKYGLFGGLLIAYKLLHLFLKVFYRKDLLIFYSFVLVTALALALLSRKSLSVYHALPHFMNLYPVAEVFMSTYISGQTTPCKMISTWSACVTRVTYVTAIMLQDNWWAFSISKTIQLAFILPH